MKIVKNLSQAQKENSYLSFFISYFYAYAGKKDQALECLERGYVVKDANMPYIIEPIYDILRDNPRFKALLRKMKLLVAE
ncbi:MAG: hypothetical protein PVF22_01170 [Candidatus Aminicenantes bacterium]|jgi:hypothetical protein